MPAVFIGHGNPMNALEQNSHTEGWSSIGKSVPQPNSILSISAHYYIPFCMVTSNNNPPTIHDFSGFPKELYQIKYSAPGNPKLAQRVKELLNPTSVKFDDNWGLDHGTWSVLKHMFPHADIPVVQLSIDETQPPAFHYELSLRLKPLRKEGVLILGSGNIVHNLASYRWNANHSAPYGWAIDFEAYVKKMVSKGDPEPLINYQKFGSDAHLAVPIPDHYLPFLYILGLRMKADDISYPVNGIDGGSVSMLAVQFG
jgi:4,5-DOPA dioxygenase extradiol